MTLSVHGVFLRNVHNSVRQTNKETYNSYVHSPLNINPQNYALINPYIIMILFLYMNGTL